MRPSSTQTPTTPDTEPLTHTCVVCGATFSPHLVRGRPTAARTCSRACAMRLRAHTRYGAPLEASPDKGSQRECPQCHRTFTVRWSGQHYCSPTCAQQFGKIALSPRTCRHCGQTFVPKRAGQVCCSRPCAQGVALGRIRPSSRTSDAAREHLRQLQRQRLADGSHPFLRGQRRAEGPAPTPAEAPRTPQTSETPLRRVRSARDARTAKAHSGASAALVPDQSHPSPLDTPDARPGMPDVPDDAPPLPPLPDEAGDIPDEPSAPAGEQEPGVPTGAAGRWPLTFPLQGEEARNEWGVTGQLRAAQADKALRREEVRTPDGRTIILAGQGSYLGVEGFGLVCHQGRTHGAPTPEREVLYPALHGVRRIIWIGAHGHLTGTMTLAAAAWCQREGIHLCVLDGAGMPLLDVTPAEYPFDPELRRRQWLISSGLVLPGSPPAGVIVRELVRRKIEGQYRTLSAHPELPGQAQGLALFEGWREWLRLNPPPRWQHDPEYLRKVEGRLAFAYFRAWEGWPLTWSKPDARRIPPHWLRVRSRVSPLSPQRNARHAVDPVNACLNYCYACLASQCRQALLAEGFDLAGGFLHADKAARDSLTYDLMELARASVDDLLLSFLGRITLHYGDFARSAEGHVTLHPQLTRLLLAECRVPQSRVDGHARWLRRFLLTGSGDIADGRRDDAPAEAPHE